VAFICVYIGIILGALRRILDKVQNGINSKALFFSQKVRGKKEKRVSVVYAWFIFTRGSNCFPHILHHKLKFWCQYPGVGFHPEWRQVFAGMSCDCEMGPREALCQNKHSPGPNGLCLLFVGDF
jgi:hypothetical protein